MLLFYPFFLCFELCCVFGCANLLFVCPFQNYANVNSHPQALMKIAKQHFLLPFCAWDSVFSSHRLVFMFICFLLVIFLVSYSPSSFILHLQNTNETIFIFSPLSLESFYVVFYFLCVDGIYADLGKIVNAFCLTDSFQHFIEPLCWNWIMESRWVVCYVA